MLKETDNNCLYISNNNIEEIYDPVDKENEEMSCYLKKKTSWKKEILFKISCLKDLLNDHINQDQEYCLFFNLNN